MHRQIPLSRGLVTLVSERDHERVSRYKWCVDRNGYAVRMESFYVNGKRRRRKIMLHRFILGAPAHLQVDHINHDILDNRRENIRLVTRQQNRANSRPKRNSTSRYKGVHWHKRDKRWCAMINAGGDKRYLGTFVSELDAARAYDEAARRLVGPIAYLNLREQAASPVHIPTESQVIPNTT